MRRAHEQTPKHDIPVFGDPQLRSMPARVSLSRTKPQVGSDRTALGKARGVFQRQDECQGRQRTHSRDLSKQRSHRVAFLAQSLDLSVHRPDLLGQLLDHPQHRRKAREEIFRDGRADALGKGLRRARRKPASQGLGKASHLVDELGPSADHPIA